MTVSRICQREVDLVEADETVQTAGQRMGARSVGSLVVLNHKRQPIGIITDRDLAVHVVGRGSDPNRVRVRDLMSSEVATVTEQTSIEDAIAAMRETGVRRLPVVGFEGQLIGMVTFDDVFALLAGELGQMGALLDRVSPRRLANS